jgi:hypothetical protein
MSIDEQENNDLASQSPNTQRLVDPLLQVLRLCCLGRAVLRRSFVGQFLCPNSSVRRKHQGPPRLNTLLTNHKNAEMKAES